MNDMEMVAKKMEGLLEDEQFVNEMKNAVTCEDTVQVLAAHGIEMTAEQVHDLIIKANALLEKQGYVQDGELTEECLATVAGGRGPSGISRLFFGGEVACVGAIVAGAATGPAGWACLGVAALCGFGAFSTYWL